MSLAVSNIAWAPDEELAMARLLEELAVTEVELAPTKVFPDPLAVTDTALKTHLAIWSDHGIRVRAFQSLLFGHADLALFGEPESRAAMSSRVEGFIELAGRMGATALVFGSPRNRRVPEGMGSAEADDIAVEFFGRLGAVASRNGTWLCIEPNPTAYDCNYVTDAAAGRLLVERVGVQGFGLHLDAAGMALAGDDPGESIRSSAHVLRHFHVSAPQLGEIEQEVVDHAAAAAALEAVGFDGAVSIEMRSGQPGENEHRVRSAVAIARRHYGRAGG